MPSLRSGFALLGTLAVLISGCGGDDDSSGSGGDLASEVESCLQDAGFDTAVQDVNALDAKDVDAGVVSAVRTTDPDDPTVAEVIRVFETPEQASTWAGDQPTYGGTVTYEAHGELAVEASDEDSPAVDCTAEVGG